MTAPGIPNELVLSTTCFGSRLTTIEDQAFAAVAMGFRKVELGLTDAPPAMNGFEDTKRETGIQVTSLVSGCLKPRSEIMASQLLASTSDDEREQAFNSVRRHILTAQRLGATTVVLRGSSVADPKLQREARALGAQLDQEGPTDEFAESIRAYVARVEKKGHRQLEHLCRSIHRLLNEFPDFRIALEPGLDFDDLLSFQAMGWVLDDLARHKVAYWHDVGRVWTREKAGLPTQGQWLEAFAGRMAGIHLQDAADQELEMPPGQGEVDFRMLCEYVPSDADRVIEINPRHGRSEILASVQYLVDMGF